MSGQLTITGDKALTTFLDNMDSKGRKKIVRYGVGRGGAVIRKETRRLAPTDTKALRRSIGVRVKVYKSGVGVAVVGPRSKFTQAAPDGSVRKPIKYAHLVEFGKDGQPGTRFFTRAFHSSKPTVQRTMQQAMKKKLREVVLGKGK